MQNQMENKMENEMETRDTVVVFQFPKIRATFLWVPVIRIKVFQGLYWGPPIWGTYHVDTLQMLVVT